MVFSTQHGRLLDPVPFRSLSRYLVPGTWTCRVPTKGNEKIKPTVTKQFTRFASSIPKLRMIQVQNPLFDFRCQLLVSVYVVFVFNFEKLPKGGGSLWVHWNPRIHVGMPQR